MRRQEQIALPLGKVEIPERLLRTAWKRCRLPQSFEEAMQLESLRIGLKYVALAIVKKRRQARCA
jgi:hypothetical protein